MRGGRLVALALQPMHQLQCFFGQLDRLPRVGPTHDGESGHLPWGQAATRLRAGITARLEASAVRRLAGSSAQPSGRKPARASSTMRLA